MSSSVAECYVLLNEFIISDHLCAADFRAEELDLYFSSSRDHFVVIPICLLPVKSFNAAQVSFYLLS